VIQEDFSAENDNVTRKPIFRLKFYGGNYVTKRKALEDIPP
jgi:hypothetical protein